MTRFFVEPGALQPDFLVLTGENARHARVLRLKQGEQVLVCDGAGQECLCTVSGISPEQVDLVVMSQNESQKEAAVTVGVYVGFPKADKLEHIIQKATELGVWEIVAFPTARSVSRPDEKSLSKKQERWQKIAQSAAQQCGRACIPQVVVLPSLTAALERAASTDLPILFYENEQATTLKMALNEKPYRSAAILTGPEGGWEEAEVAQAAAAGCKICTLGKRILRCETAPLCALSAMMYDSGEF